MIDEQVASFADSSQNKPEEGHSQHHGADDPSDIPAIFTGQVRSVQEVTVRDFKAMVYKKVDTPPDEQRLMYARNPGQTTLVMMSVGFSYHVNHH